MNEFFRPYELNLNKQYEKSINESAKLFIEAPWENRIYYGLWLGQMYYFLCHASRLISLAAAHFKIDDDEFHFRCIAHAAEEKMHERLALHDLQKIGLNLKLYPELPCIAQFYQSIYYLIQNEDPICLFGSVLYLEGLSLAIGKNVNDRLIKTYGREAATFFIVHVEEDTGHAGDAGHVEKAFQALRSISHERERKVCWAMAVAQNSYESFMNEILRFNSQINARL